MGVSAVTTFMLARKESPTTAVCAGLCVMPLRMGFDTYMEHPPPISVAWVSGALMVMGIFQATRWYA